MGAFGSSSLLSDDGLFRSLLDIEAARDAGFIPPFEPVSPLDDLFVRFDRYSRFFMGYIYSIYVHFRYINFNSLNLIRNIYYKDKSHINDKKTLY